MISLKLLCSGAHICSTCIWAIKYMQASPLPSPPPLQKGVKSLNLQIKECIVKRNLFSRSICDILKFSRLQILEIEFGIFFSTNTPPFQSFIQENVESNAKFTWKLCWWVLWTSVIGWHVQYILKNICVDFSLSWLGSSFLWSRRGGQLLMVRWMLMILMTVMRNC